MIEIWKEIDGYDGDYQISNYGRIKSLKFNKERILNPCKNNKGYLYIGLYKNGKPDYKYIHILEFEIFNNYKIKDDECIHHIDENPLSNNFNNFQLMTKSEHRSLHMTGENHPLFGKHHSEKSKKLISEKRKEKFKNNELNLSGENNPMFGKHHSEKTRKLISENHEGMFGKHHSEKTKKLISEKMSGENGPNSKLENSDIIKIRNSNLKQKELSKIYNVSISTISEIKNLKRYKI